MRNLSASTGALAKSGPLTFNVTTAMIQLHFDRGLTFVDGLAADYAAGRIQSRRPAPRTSANAGEKPSGLAGKIRFAAPAVRIGMRRDAAAT